MRNAGKRLFFLAIVICVLIILYFLAQKLPILFAAKKEQALTLKKEAITSLVFVEESKRTTVGKLEGKWMVDSFPADEVRIDGIISTVVSLKKDEYASSNSSKYAIFEVDGKRKIEIGGKTLYIGKQYAFGRSYFRVDKDPNVYVSQEDLSNIFSPADFRDLNVHFITKEENVSMVKREEGKKVLVLTKKNNEWHIGDKKAKNDRVDFFINDMATLKGEDIVDQNTVNLAQFPLAFTFTVKEKTEKEASIYKKDKDTYYWKGVGEFIYILPVVSVSTLQKEAVDLLGEDVQ
ncbi:MAG TPA: DUF4340 domain-containing protein [Patescibacteria group bacterium]|nr:DUF4340 domain-containing protein [Patescibacteria group bacterium]